MARNTSYKYLQPPLSGLLQSNYRQMIATRGSISHDVASIFTQFTPLVPAVFGATLFINGMHNPTYNQL